MHLCGVAFNSYLDDNGKGQMMGKHTGRNPGFDRVLIEDLLLEDIVLEDVVLEDVVLEDVVLEDVVLEDVY